MAELEPTVMPEDGLWPEGIYQIETTDPVLGYDKSTGVDGPANIQWEQLANRTRYLRNLFLVGHDEDGKHNLTNDDFATGANIPESNILVTYPTQQLADDINALIADINAALDELNAEVQSSLIGVAWSLLRIIPMSWERGSDRCAFEMFTDSMRLSHGKSFRVFKAVYDEDEHIGDDSIDVTNTVQCTNGTGGMEAGEHYVLCDAEDETKWQFVSVAAVLDDERLLLAEQAQYTITDGWMRPANVAEEYMRANAETCFAWVSRTLQAFTNEDDITVTIRHDVHTDTVPIVEYLPEGGDWTEASSYRKETFFGGEDDVCIIPHQSAPFVVRVTYEALENPVSFSMIALVARHAFDIIELVRRPHVTEAVDGGASTIISGSEYLSLYEIEQGGMEVQISESAGFENVITGTATGSISEISISGAYGGCFARLRYQDAEGVYSRWSEPSPISIVR